MAMCYGFQTVSYTTGKFCGTQAVHHGLWDCLELTGTRYAIPIASISSYLTPFVTRIDL